MKMIIAIIKPFKLEAVRTALTDIGVEAMTVAEVKGFGRQRGQTEIYRGAEYRIEFIPKIRIEIAVEDDRVEKIVEMIAQTAHTGKFGDGKIFVTNLDNAMRIRTGETGVEAV